MQSPISWRSLVPTARWHALPGCVAELRTISGTVFERIVSTKVGEHTLASTGRCYHSFADALVEAEHRLQEALLGYKSIDTKQGQGDGQQ